MQRLVNYSSWKRPYSSLSAFVKSSISQNDIPQRLEKIVREVTGSSENQWRSYAFEDLNIKAEIIGKCITEFQREITNLDLNFIDGVEDLEKILMQPQRVNIAERPLFYNVDFENLPNNVCIEKDPVDAFILKPFKNKYERDRHFRYMDFLKNDLKLHIKMQQQKA
eukprot:Sdes_comp18287_c0_seq1m7964